MSEQWASEVSADQPAERGQGVDVVEQADVAVDHDESTVEVAGDTLAEPAVDVDPVEADPVVDDEVEDEAAFRAKLRLQEGDWFVIHSYAGYENLSLIHI